jgi:sugar (pentulose or hexulose) kinase
MSLNLTVSFRSKEARDQDSVLSGLPNRVLEYAWLSTAHGEIQTEDGLKTFDPDELTSLFVDAIMGVLDEVADALADIDGVTEISDDLVPMDDTHNTVTTGWEPQM